MSSIQKAVTGGVVHSVANGAPIKEELMVAQVVLETAEDVAAADSSNQSRLVSPLTPVINGLREAGTTDETIADAMKQAAYEGIIF